MLVGVLVGVSVGVGVCVGVSVFVGVCVGVSVFVGVLVGVSVGVIVGVGVYVGVGVGVGVITASQYTISNLSHSCEINLIPTAGAVLNCGGKYKVLIGGTELFIVAI